MHCGQSGSVIVVLTGRFERSRGTVESILAAGGVRPDRVVLKDMDKSTDDFKTHAVSNLLREFPKIKYVKIWEDLPENLSAFHKLSRHFPGLSWEIIDALALQYPRFKTPTSDAVPSLAYQGPGARLGVSKCLSAMGAFQQEEHQNVMQTSIRFISKVWVSAIQYHGNAMRLVVPFGSFPLGLVGDVNLCLLAPEKLSCKDCLNRLCYQLEKRGMKRTCLDHSTQCPRLQACLEFSTCPLVEYGIVFCRVSRRFIAQGMKATDGEQLLAAVVPGDQVSSIAAGGPAFHSQIARAFKG